MPKKPIDYSKGLMYRLVCRDLEVKEIYVGSTTDFASRKRQHKCACYNQNAKTYNLKVYKYMRDHGGWENWDMILIEYFPCADEYELHARERHWIEHLGSTLNCIIPTRTHKEWRDENKDTVAIQQKAWKDENKENIADWGKQYYLENLDSIRTKQKAYSQQIVTCECGSSITKGNMSTHKRTKKHIDAMAALVISLTPEPAPEVVPVA